MHKLRNSIGVNRTRMKLFWDGFPGIRYTGVWSEKTAIFETNTAKLSGPFNSIQNVCRAGLKYRYDDISLNIAQTSYIISKSELALSEYNKAHVSFKAFIAFTPREVKQHMFLRDTR